MQGLGFEDISATVILKDNKYEYVLKEMCILDKNFCKIWNLLILRQLIVLDWCPYFQI